MQNFEKQICEDDIHFILQSRRVLKPFLLTIFQGEGANTPEGGQHVGCSSRQPEGSGGGTGGLRQDMMSG